MHLSYEQRGNSGIERLLAFSLDHPLYNNRILCFLVPRIGCESDEEVDVVTDLSESWSEERWYSYCSLDFKMKLITIDLELP